METRTILVPSKPCPACHATGFVKQNVCPRCSGLGYVMLTELDLEIAGQRKLFD